MSVDIDEQEFLDEFTVSSAAKFALKRAGDWGMVEHCARYGHVFVTTDKLASLYARCKGVCVLYVDDHRSSRMGIDDDGVHRPFLQYSFAMCGSAQQVERLLYFDPDRQQTGGGQVALIAQAALLGVVFFAALI